VCQVCRLRAFVESIVNANGPYPFLNGTQIIVDAYAVLRPVAGILANSLPKAVDPAPPVPESLKRTLRSGDPEEELLAEHEANPESFREPLPFRCRFFCETSTGMKWHWNGIKMTIDGEDSIFTSPAEILECLDVIETDEFGNPLVAP
jgi:hypothetical protein